MDSQVQMYLGCTLPQSLKNFKYFHVVWNETHNILQEKIEIIKYNSILFRKTGPGLSVIDINPRGLGPTRIFVAVFNGLLIHSFI